MTTHQREGRKPFVLLMAIAMAFAYAAAGSDVEQDAGHVAVGDMPQAVATVEPTAPETPVVHDAETPDPVPSPREAEPPSSVVASPTAGEAAEAAPVDAVYPVRVRIPTIDVDASVVDLGLNQDGTLEVPTDFGVTGWYTGRSVPGETGPSVVVGHVDSYTGPAVFFELSGLEVGDLIQIDRSDGLVAWFAIRELSLVDKDEFPTQQVYGDTAEPTLRLITCGGEFDHAESSYEGNLIVYADHVGNSPSATSAEAPIRTG